MVAEADQLFFGCDASVRCVRRRLLSTYSCDASFVIYLFVFFPVGFRLFPCFNFCKNIQYFWFVASLSASRQLSTLVGVMLVGSLRLVAKKQHGFVPCWFSGSRPVGNSIVDCEGHARRSGRVAGAAPTARSFVPLIPARDISIFSKGCVKVFA